MTSYVVHLEQTEFWKRLMDDVNGARSGGAVCVIDSEDARKGVAKTSLAVTLGSKLANHFGYDLTEDDAVLSGKAYLRRIRDHPGTEQPSVIIWDEAVGAGSGDARRAMKEQNRVMGQAWQLERTKRIVHLVVLPNFYDLDSRLRRLADYRLHCLAKPIGYFKSYYIGVPFTGGDILTHGLGRDQGAQRIAFPNADAMDHPIYQSLADKKQQLLTSGKYDADDQLDEAFVDDEDVDVDQAVKSAVRRQSIKTVINAVKPWDDDQGMTYREASTLVEYTPEWVGHTLRQWMDGKHRDIADSPINNNMSK